MCSYLRYRWLSITVVCGGFLLLFFLSSSDYYFVFVFANRMLKNSKRKHTTWTFILFAVQLSALFKQGYYGSGLSVGVLVELINFKVLVVFETEGKQNNTHDEQC